MRPSRKGTADAVLRRCGERPTTTQEERLHLLLKAFAVVFAILALRLLQLHLSPHHRLTEEERRHIGRVELREPRGEILDRNGLLLAAERKLPSLWADPRCVQDPQAPALLTGARLGLDEEVIADRLCKRDKEGHPRKFVWLDRWITDIPRDTLDAIVEASEGAVYVRQESIRYYPHGDTAAHILGFVNRVGDASEGLELMFDDYLRSVPGEYTARKDSSRRLLESFALEYVPPTGGDDVHVTLDIAIQHNLEDLLDARIEECNASAGMGILLNPNTGAIYALACRPAFDPNLYDDAPAERRKNRALLDVFEPGSAFKIVTAAAALEHGLVTPETPIDCEGGYYNPYGHTIQDFHKFDVIPFAKCFEESSNIAMVKVAALLGEERLEYWIRRFGFGAPTSRDFRYESAGIFRPRNQWSGLSMGSLPMGQEIAVTMLQLAKAFAIIANGGYTVEPYVVEQAVARDGTVTYRHRPPAPQRLLSPETVDIMRTLCHHVVLRGTGTRANIPEYRAGGKTGTAQIAKPDGSGYYADRYTTVFAGFAPVADPQLVGVIVVQEPMIDLHYGGYVCGPVFRDVVREALVQLNVPEDPVVEVPPIETTLDAETDTQVAQAAPAAPPDEADSSPATTANPYDADTCNERHANTEPASSPSVTSADCLELTTAQADSPIRSGMLPDFFGMTKRQAKAALHRLGLPWDPRGAGRVINQAPPPGTPLSEVALCALEFANGPRERNHDPG